jgi:WD40 repeat protein
MTTWLIRCCAGLLLVLPFDPGALAQEPDQGKKPGAVFKAPGSHTHDVALSPDGKILARAGSGQIDGWDVASGKRLGTLTGQPHFYKVAFSPDGKTLASIGGNVAADKFEVEVKLWDVATGTERFPGKGHRIKAVSMAFSPDGKTLATSYLDPAAVKLWDVATGKEKMELGGVWGSLAFSPDGKTLAIGDSSVHLWDLTTGKKRISLARKGDWLDLRPLASSDVLGFSPDGKTLVSAGLHKGPKDKEQKGLLSLQLTLWDVATAKERATIASPGYSVPNAPPFVFTADGKTLITAVWIFEDNAGTNGRVSVQHWDLATGKARATFWTPVNPGGDHPEAGHVVGFYYAALSADGKTVAWGGAEGDGRITGTAHVWEVQSLATSPPKVQKPVAEKKKEAAEKKKDIDEQLCLTGHTSHVWSVSVSADGKRVLTSSTDKTLRLWDADTGQCLRVFEGHTGRVAFGAALSPDGKRVLSGSDDKTLRLWDADTGKEIRLMTGHTANVDGVAFGPDGMAISVGDRTMRLWDLKTGKPAGVFTGHTGEVCNVAYSDKARLAATCGHAEDPSIRLWDLGTGKELRKLTGPSPPISSVCFSSDGKRLLSSAPNDNTVRVWDVESGTELKRITAANPYNAAFSPDDKRIVSGGLHDNTVRVWDAATGKELRHYEGHRGVVTGVAFFPDGKRIASASHDGTARIWRAPR